MKITELAENAIRAMLGDDLILEDKIDDLLKRFGNLVPGSTPEAQRHTLETWATYDPSRQKKYLPWMMQMLAKKEIRTMDEHTLDHIRDLLSDFEHFITMPAFQAPRDIYQYTYAKLDSTVQANRGLMSKKDTRRGRQKQAGNVVSQVGDISVMAIKDAETLAAKAWEAYSKDNPNWDGPPHYPTDPEYNKGTEPYSVDRLWCVRNPHHGAGYIRNSPGKAFYLVLKKDWPYVGAVLSDSGSQIVNLHNRQIDAGTTEEIYDALKPVLDEYAKNRWSVGHSASSLFSRLRIVRGELQDGETINSADLSNSSLARLPNNLTVQGDLNVSGTKLTELPLGLTVKGSLIISHTAIKALPPGLKVEGNMNLSGSHITELPAGMNIGTLDISNTKISQLPAGMQVKDTLNITNTPIKQLPNDLVAGKTIYTAAEDEGTTPGLGLDQAEIRRYFFWRRLKELRANFWKSPKVTGMNEEQKEQAWQVFIPELQQYFQTSEVIGRAVSAIFEKSRPPRR